MLHRRCGTAIAEEFDLLTVTLNPALDVSGVVDVLEPERKMHCTDVRYAPGGGGVNVARVVSRLGGDVTAAIFLSAASDRRFLELLARENVATEVLDVGGAVRESLTFFERSTGRQYRFVLPGPAMARASFELGLARLAQLAASELLVIVSGSAPPGISPDDVAALVRTMKQAGASLIADVGGDLLVAVATVGVVLMKPSVRELSIAVDRALATHEEIERAARELLARGDNGAVVVSLGAAGALLVPSDDECQWLHAPPVEVRSTVGAGDSLVAGVALALHRDMPLLEAVRVGVAAGSAATLGEGTELCRPDDVERLTAEVIITKPLKDT